MFDFHGAYLNRQLNEDIYMEQPPDYKMVDHGCYIVKLHKILYSLKQVGNNLLCCLLANIGFKKTEADPAVFYIHLGNNNIILAIVLPQPACNFFFDFFVLGCLTHMAVDITTQVRALNKAHIHTFQIKKRFTPIHLANLEIIRAHHQPA